MTEMRSQNKKVLLALLVLQWKSFSFSFQQHHHGYALPSNAVADLSGSNRRVTVHSKQFRLSSRVASIKQDSSNTAFSSALWNAINNNNNDETEATFVSSSSFLYDGSFEGFDDGLLSYLPESGRYMPPRTKRLIKRVTSEYIYGADQRPQIDLGDILDVIDAEYESLSLAKSVAVGNKEFDGAKGPEEELVVQLLSFSVLNQLPKEITLCLMNRSVGGGQEQEPLKEFCSFFEKAGWEHISFPKGLGLRIEPAVASRVARASPAILQNPLLFFPPSKLPWRSLSRRKGKEVAKRGILLCSQTQAPEQNIMTKEEFLEEIENEILSAPLSALPVEKPTRFKIGISLEDALPSFPTNDIWRKVKRVVMDPASVSLSNSRTWGRLSSKIGGLIDKLKQAGRAGVMAYAFINFVLYTVGMAWQWRRITVEIPAVGSGVTLVSLTLRKFTKAFVRVYVGSSVFKLGRIVLALAIAPTAGKILKLTQRKLNVSENTAFVILITLLLKTFLGTLAMSFLGDSALRKAIPSSNI